MNAGAPTKAGSGCSASMNAGASRRCGRNVPMYAPMYTGGGERRQASCTDVCGAVDAYEDVDECWRNVPMNTGGGNAPMHTNVVYRCMYADSRCNGPMYTGERSAPLTKSEEAKTRQYTFQVGRAGGAFELVRKLGQTLALAK